MGDIVKRFDLLRWFAISSLISIGLIATLAAYLLSSFLSDHLLQRDAVVAQEFIQSIADAEHQWPPVERGPDSLRPEPIEELFTHIATMPEVIRANFYAPDRSVAWSTSASLIGKSFAANEELAGALQGRLVYELKDLDHESKAEHGELKRAVRRVIENYLPIWDPEHRQVVWVAEIYKTPRVLFDTIDQARRLVWVGTLAASAFLYATLFWMVYKGNRLIHQQQERLVEAESMAVVGEMSSAVAHSIRNPLAAIRSSAELTLESSQDPDTRESAADIVDEVDRLERSVRELLVVSRSGSCEFEPTRIEDVLERCLRDFTRPLQRLGVRLEHRRGEGLPAVLGEESLLAQMFNSLLANALEAMPRGGTLTVSERAAREGQEVQVEIADTGQGIPKERMSQLFKPLATTKRSGLGLGLTLVKRIVERHGGSITVHSEEARGTTVYVRFPAARA